MIPLDDQSSTSPSASGSDRELTIVESEDSEWPDDDVSVEPVYIDREIEKLTRSEHDEIYGALSNLPVDLDLPVPFYDISWQHLIAPRHGRLLEYILFSVRLADIVERTDPMALICHPDLDEGYSACVADVGRSYGVAVRPTDSGPSVLSKAYRALVSVVMVVPFLLDQVVSLVLGGVFAPQSDGAETVFVPGLLRLESMVPVLERASFDFDVSIKSNASSWIWWLRDSSLTDFDAAPVSLLTSVGCLRRQISLIFDLNRVVLFGDSYTAEVSDRIRTELGIELHRPIEVSVRNTFRPRLLIATFLYLLFEDAFYERTWNSVVIGTHSPGGRAIERAAIDNGAESFHIPHSIATGYAPNPPPQLTQFVAGSLDVEFFRESPQVREPWNMAVTGRPYLTELNALAADEADCNTDGGDRMKILVATQPLRQRMEFVSDVLDAVSQARSDVEVTLKLHPSEDPGDYAKFFSEYDFVRVEESNLRSLLSESDLTLTINSNVGLESAILGTPSACVNYWSPALLTPPFASRSSAIPALETGEELRSFLAGLTDAELEALRRDQEEFVHESYVLDEDAVQNIVDHLAAYAE